jgi:hypothetical protein
MQDNLPAAWDRSKGHQVLHRPREAFATFSFFALCLALSIGTARVSEALTGAGYEGLAPGKFYRVRNWAQPSPEYFPHDPAQIANDLFTPLDYVLDSLKSFFKQAAPAQSKDLAESAPAAAPVQASAPAEDTVVVPEEVVQMSRFNQPASSAETDHDKPVQ